jgi:hypothetical protein
MLSNIIGFPLKTKPSPNRKDRIPLRAAANELQTLYTEKKLSCIKIGRLFNVTPACIQKYLKKYGIPRRTTREARACQ